MVERLTHELALSPAYQFTALGFETDEYGEVIDWGVPLIPLLGGPPPRHPHLFPWLIEHQDDFYNQWLAFQPDLTYLPQPWWTTRIEGFTPPSPLVATIHDFAWEQLRLGDNGFSAETDTLLRCADTVVFLSAHQQAWAQSQHTVTPGTTRIIPNGHLVRSGWEASIHALQHTRTYYPIPSSYFLAFHIGAPSKDPETILRGYINARRVSNLIPPLVIAGLDTDVLIPGKISPHHPAYPWVQKITRLIEFSGLRLGKDLFILGAVEDDMIEGLYAGAAAVISASLSEGEISGTMYEAMLSKVPLIYTDLPSSHERMRSGEAVPPYGYPFKTGDINGLVAHLLSVVHHRAAAQVRAESAYGFARQQTWAQAAYQYLLSFHQALEGVL